MKKKFWLMAVFMLVFAVAAAGFAAHNAAGNGAPGQPDEAQHEDREEQEKRLTETTETAVGIYVGMADNHTVEINVEGLARAFGLAEGVVAAALQDGDRVRFEYSEGDHGRLVITHLVKVTQKEPGTDKDKSNEAEIKENEIHWAEGILTGRIDNHSVEIEVGGQPQAFALSEALQEKDFAKGAITFHYYVDKNGRSIITEADFQQPRQSEVHTAEGIFQGLADNHTVEIEIKGVPRAFALDADISFTGFTEGDKIFIAYQENEQGRQEIIKIEKIF